MSPVCLNHRVSLARGYRCRHGVVSSSVYFLWSSIANGPCATVAMAPHTDRHDLTRRRLEHPVRVGVSGLSQPFPAHLNRLLTLNYASSSPCSNPSHMISVHRTPFSLGLVICIADGPLIRAPSYPRMPSHQHSPDAPAYHRARKGRMRGRRHDHRARKGTCAADIFNLGLVRAAWTSAITV